MKHLGNVFATLLVGVIATAAAVVGATPAQAQSDSGGTPVHIAQTDAATQAGEAGINAGSDCAQWLETWQYTVTNARFAACWTGSIIGGTTGISVCTGALKVTGVTGWIAASACVLAVAPSS